MQSGWRTTHCQYHHRGINQAIIQRHLTDAIGKLQAGALHCLTHPIPRRRSGINLLMLHYPNDGNAITRGAVNKVDFLDLQQLFFQWPQHQPLHGLSGGAGILHGNQTGPIGKTGIFLTSHIEVGGDTDQRQHANHQPQQTLSGKQETDHGSISTRSPSTSLDSPA